MADFPDPSVPSHTARNHKAASQSFPRSSSTSTHASVTGSPLAINTNSTSKPHTRQLSSPEIIAPTPRRHLLESNASQSWLHTPPHSPVSSRGVSPTSTRAMSPLSRGANGHHSFGSFLEQGASKLGTVKESSKSEVGLGRRWIRWMHKRGMRDSLVAITVMSCVVLKFCLGLGSYSGEKTPPMYGDYEAQRHWMEITAHLPTGQWYTYDLQYWGLDYPPLTAYVSWICGIIAHFINPTWVALDASRGIETPESKFFMRASVAGFDAIIYVPALLLFSRYWFGTRSKRTQDLAFLILMTQPALFLIDSGHFQYNSVMLGFTVMALNCFATGNDLIGAVCFVLSLGFKQMALYYAPAIGSYLLAKCVMLGPKDGGRLFIRLGLITVSTFVLLFLPWIPPFTASPSAILDPITRIFPFARGLFEDKVANFWCASNVVMKWKRWAAQAILVKAAAALTLLGFLPGVMVLGKAGWDLKTWDTSSSRSKETMSSDVDDRTTPTGEESSTSSHTPIVPLLPYALLNASMSFFLFSFQVHEKTILLPLLPLTLLLSGASQDSAVFAWGALGNNVAVFSMWPLLKKDGLGLQTFALVLLWNRLIGHNPFNLVSTIYPVKSFVNLLSACVYAAIITLHLLETIITPPARYPDLFPVLNVLVSTPVFVCLWLWSIKCCVQVSWAISGPLSIGSSGTGSAGVLLDPRQRVSSVLSDASDKPALFHHSSSKSGLDRTRTVSLGYAQSKRVRRSSTHSVSGASSAIPSSASIFRTGAAERGSAS